jgi:HTH-type transcriptional regulator/antitoxin HigA
MQWLDQLIDEVGENEQHPLVSLMDIIGVLIEYYENEYIPELQEAEQYRNLMDEARED